MNGVQVGLGLIKECEECRLVAYKPLATDPWTIGWGATGPMIGQGTRWTQEEADADLNNRVNTLASEVRECIIVPMTDNQLGAMLDLAYNIGINAFKNSTLVRLFNGGNTQGAAEQFLVWDESAGAYVQGLENRREAEQNVFLT